MDINKFISKIRSFREEAPTMSVGDGSSTALPPAEEPGVRMGKRKKKKDWNYLKGGKGSRKFWLQNLKDNGKK